MLRSDVGIFSMLLAPQSLPYWLQHMMGERTEPSGIFQGKDQLFLNLKDSGLLRGFPFTSAASSGQDTSA